MVQFFVHHPVETCKQKRAALEIGRAKIRSYQILILKK